MVTLLAIKVSLWESPFVCPQHRRAEFQKNSFAQQWSPRAVRPGGGRPEVCSALAGADTAVPTRRDVRGCRKQNTPGRTARLSRTRPRGASGLPSTSSRERKSSPSGERFRGPSESAGLWTGRQCGPPRAFTFGRKSSPGVTAPSRLQRPRHH